MRTKEIEKTVAADLRRIKAFRYNERDYAWDCAVGLLDPEEEIDLMNDWTSGLDLINE